MSLLDALARGAGLLGGDQLDEVGDDKVAWDEKVEEEAELDVVSAEIMAADADENAILRGALGYLVYFHSSHMLEARGVLPFGCFQSPAAGSRPLGLVSVGAMSDE
jgi:hypothetical protein